MMADAFCGKLDHTLEPSDAIVGHINFGSDLPLGFCGLLKDFRNLRILPAQG